MSVGATGLTCYQSEDVSWQFTNADIATVPDITGMAIKLVIKAAAAALDPPLIGPITLSIASTVAAVAATQIVLAAGSYVYSVRRTDSGFSWQLAQGALTVLDSASID